uniref:Protein kinase domain-containing protein n=1 Tax=Acrobeloides nanus TaxID=290746 RepID=A0A914EJ20_9BILA
MKIRFLSKSEYHKTKLQVLCPTTRIFRETEFHLPFNYNTNLKTLGFGAYGVVGLSTIKSSGLQVAIKKINISWHHTLFAKRIIREIELLSQIEHENIISLLEVYTSNSNPKDLDTIYLATEFAGDDIYYVSQNHKLEQNQIIHITFQIFKALEYLHAKGIVHRDLKPQNISVSSDGLKVKILDFGLARYMSDKMTSYVVTCLYRAPEILCQLDYDRSDATYKGAVDVWSVGCIICELIMKTPLFNRTTSANFPRKELELIEQIFYLCGTPSIQYIAKIPSDLLRQAILQFPRYKRQDFHSIFNVNDTKMVDLLDKIFVIEPSERITAYHAMKDELFQSFYSNHGVYVRPTRTLPDRTLKEQMLEKENQFNQMSIEEFKNYLWEKCLHFKKKSKN